MKTKTFKNKHDPRYRFQVETDSMGVKINQIDHLDQHLIYNPCVWGQWAKSPTTVPRSERMIKRLKNEKPTITWFRQHVAWLYPIDG
jgi:hypothetical protein